MSANQDLRIGLMGGTFDPVHLGHLVTAEEARDQFRLEQVIFVPAGMPPHKKDYRVTDALHRYEMTKLAIASNPYFHISDVEINRPGYSFAIDTVSYFAQAYGSNCRLYFITGADAILEILTWKQVHRLVDLCEFIAATRPGYNLELDPTLEQLPPAARDRIHQLEVPALSISSTDIRCRVREKRTIKYLLPETVERYIIQKGIYST
ncbi:MAG: nicotinate-nucleotide adenylyltransferase [Bacillota bacterium]